MKENPKKRPRAPPNSATSEVRGYTWEVDLGTPTICSVSTVTLLEADQSLMASLWPRVMAVSSVCTSVYSRKVQGSGQLVSSPSLARPSWESCM